MNLWRWLLNWWAGVPCPARLYPASRHRTQKCRRSKGHPGLHAGKDRVWP